MQIFFSRRQRLIPSLLECGLDRMTHCQATEYGQLFYSEETCCCSVPKSCLTIYNYMDCSTPGPSALNLLPVCSNSRPLNRRCYLIISDAPFSFDLQCFPVSRSFLMSLLFAASGQSTGASVSASVLPMNIQD